MTFRKNAKIDPSQVNDRRTKPHSVKRSGGGKPANSVSPPAPKKPKKSGGSARTY